MQSRRDCRPDPRFDHLVAVLYNDVGKYEEQVCVLHLRTAMRVPCQGDMVVSSFKAHRPLSHLKIIFW